MNILITGAWKWTEADLDAIRAQGHTVLLMPDERGELPCDPAAVEAVIANGLFLYHPIEAFPSLAYVQLTSAGFDRMPMDYAAEHGITVRNARGVYSTPMAELALWAVLDLYKQGRFFAANQAARRWEKHRGLRELYGKTVCIVGCGSIGTECALRFAAFGCRVVGIDLCPREDSRYAAMYPVDDLSAHLPEADILVLTLPLTEQTHHLIGREELEALPAGAVVVNIARGAVLDTEALAEALAERELYAALDVFEEEPLPSDSPLWGMDNLWITPHNSFVGEGNADRLSAVILGNLSERSAHP